MRDELADDAAPISIGAAVVFQGGEPLLDAELADRVERARKAGARRVVVQTNARLLSVSLAQALRAAGLDAVDVSLHGSTAAMHDHHTQRPGSFDETLAGARAAHAAGIEVGVTTVVTRSNQRHLSEIVELAAKLGAASIHFVGVAPFGRALENADTLVPTAELVAPHLQRAKETASRLTLRVLFGDRSDPLFAGLGRVAEATPTRDACAPAACDRDAPFQSATPSC